MEKASAILIIDDSVETIQLLTAVLSGMGEIRFATSGGDGVRLAKERPPDLILLDIDMPEMDGYRVCKALSSHQETRFIPVIIMTAKDGFDSEIAALDAGAVDFIPKPFNPPIVQARVRTQLRLRQRTYMLSQLAERDHLTDLFNRRYLDAALAREFERHRRSALPIAIGLIDIDHFKAFNDHYGHPKGDQCLQIVASVLRKAFSRPGEIIARYGGEEFSVILPHTPPDIAEQLGKRLCSLIMDVQYPHQCSPTAPYVTVSSGFASLVPNQTDQAQALIEAADRALYHAKSRGRNQTVLAEYPKRHSHADEPR